jgi:hypothetical protein
MKSIISHQHLPREWAEREKLRDKGQFWTPDWVADAMVRYVSDDSNLVFDPAVGKGAFYFALREINQSDGKNVKFYGTDIDEQLVAATREDSSFIPDTCQIELRDFISDPPNRIFKSIVANPPYIRHHRLSDETKKTLRRISLKALDRTLDGRAGIHVYFLIQALQLLAENGKLAFIMPADTCEGIFSTALWRWVTRDYHLECVITFDPEATPFPNVDTNAVIFLIRNAPPKKSIMWVRVLKAGTRDLSAFISSKFKLRQFDSLRIGERNLDEALETGLSRDPERAVSSKYTLSRFAYVMRGIATGANEFFFLNREEWGKLRIPAEFLIPAIGRTRDVDGFYVTEETMDRLNSKGRPTLLFAPDGRKLGDFPPEVQQYLKQGEDKGLPNKPLISSRNPWYKMERRKIPPFLFAYLGRRNARFIRNLANVVPLTGFLCVYPLTSNQDYLERLWQVLQHPETVNNLTMTGKSYGAGAIKVEPRSLERLPIPEKLVQRFELFVGQAKLIE